MNLLVEIVLHILLLILVFRALIYIKSCTLFKHLHLNMFIFTKGVGFQFNLALALSLLMAPISTEG